jgi:ABC-type taurine transport system substrate-binding protein
MILKYLKTQKKKKLALKGITIPLFSKIHYHFLDELNQVFIVVQN